MSTLLEQASLVMIPSGYKEDVVYSQIPTDGSGDLSFTRASNGTRINSAGLVEVCPWNLLENTDTFSSWNLEGGTLTSGFTAPDGSSTAYKYVQIPGGGLYSGSGGVTADVKFAQVWIKSVSGGSITCNISDGAAFFGTLNVTGEWQLFTAPYTANSRIGLYLYSISNASGIYVWHPQVNIGSTAKPYFPTTDRLNVPRLTYQNGGGGCPSLLLEKQSTNICLYSQDISNTSGSYWGDGSSGGTATLTANYAISPDGTQNATRVQLNQGSLYAVWQQVIGTTSGVSYTYSIWMKAVSGTPTIMWVYDGTANQNITLTNDWVRYTWTFTAGTVMIGRFGVWDNVWGTSSTADILAWGAQLEQSSYPTSYIPTTSSSATRVADVCYKTGISSLIGQSEGVIFFDGYFGNETDEMYAFIQNSLGSSTTSSMYLIKSSSGIKFQSYDSSTTLQWEIQGGSYTIGQRIKIAGAYKANDIVLYVNGVQIGTDTSATIPTCTALQIGVYPASPTANFQYNGKVNQAILFPTRLTNAELASLTTI